MVNVISKNKKFNISQSLYESILKNDPKLLKESSNYKDANGDIVDITNDASENKFIKDDDRLKKKAIDVISRFFSSSEKQNEMKKIFHGFCQEVTSNKLKDEIKLGASSNDELVFQCLGQQDLFKSNEIRITKDSVINFADEKIHKLNSEEKKELIDNNEKAEEKIQKYINSVLKNTAENWYNPSNISTDKELEKDKNLENMNPTQNYRSIKDMISKYTNRIEKLKNKLITQNTLEFLNYLIQKYDISNLSLSEKENIKKGNSSSFGNSFLENKKMAIYGLFNNIQKILNDENIEENKNNISKNMKLFEKIENNKDFNENIDKKFIKLSNEIIEIINRGCIINPSKKTSIKFKDVYNVGNTTLDINNACLGSLLSYLTDDEFKNFLETMDDLYGNEQNGYTRKNNDYYSSIGKKDLLKIRDFTEKYTFKSDVQKNVKHFYEQVEKLLDQRLPKIAKGLGWNYNINYFGKARAEFIYDKPKKQYCDLFKNTNTSLYDIPFYIFYKKTDDNLFWQNTSYIRCFSDKAWEQIRSTIAEVAADKVELNVSQSVLVTGLKTKSIIYILKPNDDIITVDNIKDRNGNDLFSEEEKQEINNIPNLNDALSTMTRYYFIIVSEGLFNKYNMIKKMYNGAKNLLGIDNNSGAFKRYSDKTNRIH